jgi:murein DD-endopeptidase MepM/ murein hydrolase activator NlpD
MLRRIGWPLDRNIIRRGKLNHTFGMVRRNRDGSRRPHQGWDFEAEEGTPCYAIADGYVKHVREVGAYGLQVILQFEHDFDDDGEPDTLFAFYAHLSRVDVKGGERVKLGQQIGLTGNSGNAKSMRGKDQHLHFELRTQPITGRGLGNRYTPKALFGMCPLHDPQYRLEGAG